MSNQIGSERRRSRSQSLTTRFLPNQADDNETSSKEMMNKVLIKREKMILEQMTRQLRLLDVKDELEIEDDYKEEEADQPEEAAEENEDEEDGRAKTPPFKLLPLWTQEKKPLQTRTFEKDRHFKKRISQSSEPIDFERMRHCRYLRHKSESKRRDSAPVIRRPPAETCEDIDGIDKCPELKETAKTDEELSERSNKAIDKKQSITKKSSISNKNQIKKTSVSAKKSK